MVKRAEIARFLGVESAEVDRMIELDDLPAIRVPGQTRPSVRIYLVDFHRWLLRGADPASEIRDYPGFVASFQAARK